MATVAEITETVLSMWSAHLWEEPAYRNGIDDAVAILGAAVPCGEEAIIREVDEILLDTWAELGYAGDKDEENYLCGKLDVASSLRESISDKLGL